jgi:hypothetical protein
MLDRHEPDKQFVDNLEWQIGAEVRRRNRNTTPGHPLWRLARVAAVVLVSMALGAAAMGASYQIEESWRKELLVSKLEMRANLVGQRLQMLAGEMERLERQYEAGVISKETLGQSRLQLAEAEMQAKMTQLEMEEVMLSGREPNDELSAPLVDGRDFVSERIRLQVELLNRHLQAAVEELQRAQERVEAGVTRRAEVDALQVAMREVMAQRDVQENRLTMREGILQGRISPLEAELVQLRADAEHRAEVLRLRLTGAATEVEDYRSRVAAGVADEGTLRQMELQLSEIEAQLQLAEREQQIVEGELDKIRGRQ